MTCTIQKTSNLAQKNQDIVSRSNLGVDIRLMFQVLDAALSEDRDFGCTCDTVSAVSSASSNRTVDHGCVMNHIFFALSFISVLLKTTLAFHKVFSKACLEICYWFFRVTGHVFWKFGGLGNILCWVFCDGVRDTFKFIITGVCAPARGGILVNALDAASFVTAVSHLTHVPSASVHSAKSNHPDDIVCILRTVRMCAETTPVYPIVKVFLETFHFFETWGLLADHRGFWKKPQ